MHRNRTLLIFKILFEFTSASRTISGYETIKTSDFIIDSLSVWWDKIPQPEKQYIDIFVLGYFDNDNHYYFIPINLLS